jgi:microcystin-dependent protein
MSIISRNQITIFNVNDGEQGPTGPQGPQGDPGQDGSDGQSVEIIFSRAAQQPSTPPQSSGIPSGWYSDINSVPSSIDPLWSSVGRRDGTATSWIWQKPVKMEGTDSRGLTLEAETQVITMTSRGVITQGSVEIILQAFGIPYDQVTWSISDGSLLDVELNEAGDIDPTKKLLDSYSLTGSTAHITVQAQYGGTVYSTSISISKVKDGEPYPIYLGNLESSPASTDIGPLYVGDYFLYIGDYDGPNIDPGDQGINPTLAEINEFIYGRLYRYIGNDSSTGEYLWKETRESDQFAAAQKDALEIAKATNKYTYAAVVIAQLGLFNDLIIGNTIRSANYEETDDIPDIGFLLDGARGVIKVVDLLAYNSAIVGSFESSGFKTLDEQSSPITISTASSPSLNIWKYGDFVDNFYDAKGNQYNGMEGYFKGNYYDRILLAHNQKLCITRPYGVYYDEDIGPLSGGTLPWQASVYGQVFGSVVNVRINGYTTHDKLKVHVNQHRADGSQIQPDVRLSGDFTNHSFNWELDPECAYIALGISNTRLFYTEHVYIDGLSLHTVETYNGVVCVNDSAREVTTYPHENAESYHYDEDQFHTQVSPVQDYPSYAFTPNDILSKIASTSFFNLFGNIPLATTVNCSSGQIHVNGTLYTVYQINRSSNRVLFNTNKGALIVDNFVEGTNTGIYTHLSITQTIIIDPSVPGIRVKNILPWSGQSSTYDIGSVQNYFRNIFVRGLVGLVSAFAMSVPPDGWLECNGAAVSRSAYSELFNAIGTTFGAGNGSTTFNIPDLRGEFIRGWDHGVGRDPGRSFGSYQADEFKTHQHSMKVISGTYSGAGGSYYDRFTVSGNQLAHYVAARDPDTPGGSENRPRNRALLYCIKY